MNTQDYINEKKTQTLKISEEFQVFFYFFKLTSNLRISLCKK